MNTRQQWSKYICGMINSGLGGVLYGGIFDNGEVNGFMMSPYQRVHVALQLQEVLQRFQPPVPPDLVSVQFVPIREPFDQGDFLLTWLLISKTKQLSSKLSKGSLPTPKRMNFRKSSKRPLTPPPHFRKIILRIFHKAVQP